MEPLGQVTPICSLYKIYTSEGWQMRMGRFTGGAEGCGEEPVLGDDDSQTVWPRSLHRMAARRIIQSSGNRVRIITLLLFGLPGLGLLMMTVRLIRDMEAGNDGLTF